MINSVSPEHEVWARLATSPMVREQQVAFTCATGVALALKLITSGAPALSAGSAMTGSGRESDRRARS